MEAGKQAMNSVAKFVAEAVRKGRAPPESELQTMLVDIMLAFFLGSGMKQMEHFDSAFARRALSFLKDDKAPERVKVAAKKHKDQIAEAAKKSPKLADLCKPTPKGAEYDGICREAAQAAFGQAMKKGLGVGFEQLSSGSSESQALKSAEAELDKGADIQKSIDAEVEKSVKKRGVKLCPPR